MEWFDRLRSRVLALIRGGAGVRGWLAAVHTLVNEALTACSDPDYFWRLRDDAAARKDLHAQVRWAEGMLGLCIRTSAQEIAYYRVHPEEAMPRPRRPQRQPLALAPPQPPAPPAIPVFRMRPQDRLIYTPRPAKPGALPRRKVSRITTPMLILRLLAVRAAAPKLERYAWRYARAEMRRTLLRRVGPRSPAHAPLAHVQQVDDALRPMRTDPQQARPPDTSLTAADRSPRAET